MERRSAERTEGDLAQTIPPGKIVETPHPPNAHCVFVGGSAVPRVQFGMIDRKAWGIPQPEAALQNANGIIEIFSRLVGGGRCLLYTSPSPRDGLLSRMPS